MDNKNNFNQNILIGDIVRKFIAKAEDDNMQKLFINTNNVMGIGKFINGLIGAEFGQGINVKVIDVEKKNFPKAYYPFLDLIKEDLEYREDKVEGAIKNADVYYFHRSMLKEYLLGRPAKRYEDIMLYIDSELEYEREELYRSLLNLINLDSSQGENVYIFKNIQNLSSSAIEFTKYILENNCKGNDFFIFLFGQEYRSLSEADREIWVDLLEGIKNEDYYFRIDSSDDYSNNHQIIGKASLENRFDLNRVKIEEIIVLSEDSFNLLALQEAKKHLKTVYDFIIDNGVEIGDKYYSKLLMLLGHIDNLLSFKDSALDYYNIYLNYSIERGNKREIVDAYRNLAMVNLNRYSLQMAEKYIIKGLKLARELDDEILILKCNITLHGVLISSGNYLENSLDNNYYRVVSELEYLCDKYNYYNSYSGICGSMAGDTAIDLDKRLKYSNKGLDMAKKVNNKSILASLYHNKGMIYSLIGDNEKSFEFYKRSEKFKLEIGNNLEIIKIYNGLGYAYFYVEDYKEAVKYYNKALPFLKSTKDHKEIASNFYNVAITYFFALEYQSAIKYFEKTLTLLDVLNSDNIPFHSIYGIYSLLVSSYFKVNKPIKAKEYINKINLAKPDFNQEEINYYKMGEAFVEKVDGRTSKAIDIFQELIDNADINSFHKYLIPKVYYEYGLLLKESKEVRRAKVILEEGIQISKKMGYSFHKNLMFKLLKGFDGEVFKLENLEFEEAGFDIESIIDYIKQETIMSDLYKRIDEINFLNKLQKIFLESQSSIEGVIKEISNLIGITFTVDFIGFYLIRSGSLESIYSSEDDLKLEAKKVADILSIDKREIFIPSLEDDHRIKEVTKEFGSIINIPLIRRSKIIGNIILANKEGKEVTLDQDVLRILSIASKQILVAFSNKELEKKLTIKNSELEKVNSSVKNLLDNVGQGFLSFGSDLLIDKEYSLECKNIFGFDIGSRKFIDIINLSQQDKTLMEKVLRELLTLGNSDFVKEQMYIGLLPKKLEINENVIKVKYNLISQKGQNKVMVILTDISEKIELEDKMREERSNLKMVVKAVSNRNDFKNRIDDYRNYSIKGIKEILSKDISSRDILYDIYRAVHTFKGDFSQWYMSSSIKKLQKIESKISKLIENSNKYNRGEVIGVLNNLELDKLLDDDLDMIVSSLGYDFFEVEETITIDKQSIIDIEEQIISIFSPKEYNLLLPQVRRWRYKSLKEILANYPENVMALAERLGKKVGEFNLIGDDILVEEEIYYGFFKSLVHIFRNILDHGIEDPEERLNKGKEEKGQIFCRVKEVGFDIVLLIGDDGRGIDLDLIKERAVDRGFYNRERVNNLAEGELLNLIFSDEFSTKEVVDNISGRGIGLSAVKSEVEKLGGTIEVFNKVEEGCEFKITLPHKEKLVDIENSIEIITGIFVEKLNNFFRENMDITLFEAGRIKNREISPYLRELKVVLDIDSIDSYHVILTVDYNLAKEILNSFIIGEVSEGEEEELMQEVLQEVLNIIVGNSVQYLEDNKNSVLFGPPKRLNSEDLESYDRGSRNLSLKLKTIYGSLTLSLILKKL